MGSSGAFRRGLCLALLAACVVGLGGSCSRRQASPGKVVVYCSVDQNIAEPVIAEFQRLTGLEVLARFDTEATKTAGLAQKIRAEAAKPLADVFWSGEVFHTVRLAQEGMLDDCRELAKDWPEQFVDPGGRWVGLALRARVIVYNTQRVPADQAPRSLEDLLEARWKGRVVMASPAFGTTGGDVASWFVHYGPDTARAILEALKANGLRLVDGNSTVVRMVASGQADAGMTDTDDVYAGQRNGWPVERNFLDQGGRGTLTIPNSVAIIKGCPNRPAAERFVRFLLHEGAEEMMARSDSHNTPVQPDVAGKFPQYALPRALEVNYEEVAARLEEAIRTAREILR